MIQPRFKAPQDAPPTERTRIIALQQEYQWTTLALSLRNDRQQFDILQQDLVLFKEIVLDLQSTPPLGITLDLLALWRQGEQFTPRPLNDADKPFERFYLQLQNEVYYRLVRMPSFQRLRRRWLTLPQHLHKPSTPPNILATTLNVTLSLRERALIYLVTLLYQPIRRLLIESFRPHPLPPFAPDAPPPWLDAPLDAIERLEAQLQSPGWLSLHLHAMLQEWSRLHPDQWLPPTAHHILTHFALLPTKLQRIRWEQIAAIDTQLTPCQDLRHFFALRDHGYRESRLPTRSTAPEGGYHGICRTGPVENMLHSELLFWDDSLGEDHFSLRWIEGELLFYEREQSRSFTWQRRLVVVLDLDPGEIRYKHPAHPAPGHTLLFGFLARMFQDLRQICPEELLRFDIHLGPHKDWKEDAPLLQLYFSHLPQIGASTTLQLQPQPIPWLQQQPTGSGEMRLLIMNASRWHAHQNQPLPHHLSLLWTPHPQLLHHPHHNPSQPHPTTHRHPTPDEAATPQPSTRTTQQSLRHTLPQLGVTPDFCFFQAGLTDPLPALAQLREDVLESILRTSLLPKV